MLCFMCCFTNSQRLCYCRRGRPIRVVSTSDMTIVNMAAEENVPHECVIPLQRPIILPRRSRSEPPVSSERVNFVRFRSLRDRRESRPPVFRASFVSIPSSSDVRRSQRRRRRRVARRRMERELSATTLSSSSSDRVFTTKSSSVEQEMNNNNEEGTFERLQSMEFDDLRKQKSPSHEAVIVNGKETSGSQSLSSSERNGNIQTIEKLKLSSPGGEGDLPENWNMKDSYRKELERYIRNTPPQTNPWADPFEEDRRSRTEQWVESISPGGEESAEEAKEEEEKKEVEMKEHVDEVAEESENSSITKSMSIEDAVPPGEEENEIQEPPVKADVELVWEEHPHSNKEVLHDVVIRLNGKPVKNSPSHPAHIQIARIRSEDTDELPPSETSFVSSTIDKSSLAKHRFRSNLAEATEHSGGTVSLDEIERFWNYQYAPDSKEREEKLLAAADKRRSHTPTVERVVMYYTSDKRPSIATLSPSPVPSSYSLSSASDAFKLFDRKSISPMRSSSPSPFLKEISHPSLESDDLNISQEQEALAEEITIEVPVIAPRKSSKEEFFRLEHNSESEQEGADGRVVLAAGSLSPSALDTSPHPKLRVSRGTSTEDLPGSSEGRSVHVGRAPGIYPQPKQSSSPEAAAAADDYQDMESDDHEHEHNVADIAIVLSDVDSSSMEDLVIETRPSSSSPMKSVHFAQQLDADIDSLPKHHSTGQRISPKPILKRADRRTEEMRKVMEHAADSMYRDLRMLVEERDRAKHAIELLPYETPDLSAQAAMFQTNYRDKLWENKGVLDAKIEHFWKRLKDLPMNEYQSSFVYAVDDPKALTMNVRRKVIPARYLVNSNNFQVERRTRTDLELASDYAKKLADIRKSMIRRDSDIVRDDEKSVEEILKRVSASLASLKS